MKMNTTMELYMCRMHVTIMSRVSLTLNKRQLYWSGDRSFVIIDFTHVEKVQLIL